MALLLGGITVVAPTAILAHLGGLLPFSCRGILLLRISSKESWSTVNLQPCFWRKSIPRIPSGSMSAIQTSCCTATPPIVTPNSPRPRNGNDRPSTRDMSVFTWSNVGCFEGEILWSTLGFRIVTLAPVSTRNMTSVPWIHAVISGPLLSSPRVLDFTDGCTSLFVTGDTAVLRLASPAVPRFPAAVGCPQCSRVESGRGLHTRGSPCSQRAVSCCEVSRVVVGYQFGSSQLRACWQGL